MKWMHVFLCGALCSCPWLVHSGKAMTVNVGASRPSFSIQLPANPTTGYQWRVTQYNSTLFKLKSHQYIAPKTRLIGAAGMSQFTFVRRPGKSIPRKTHMIFTYLQPWNPASADVTDVTVNFK